MDYILAYADDIVLLTPSWSGLQSLLDILFDVAKAINMPLNTSQTVCMVFYSYNKSITVSLNFNWLVLT